MLDSIVDLTKTRPHMRTSARYDTNELRVYHEGYYAGVIFSLRVAELAIGRFELATRTRRAAAKAKKSA